ncbi:MAG: DUF11 domain-containing protein [Gammaproteobacteria bacterium]|nr:DUF11 domain-containing protein [Gammaproteobacteria bacterium]
MSVLRLPAVHSNSQGDGRHRRASIPRRPGFRTRITSRLSTTLGLALVFALSLAGCGGDSSDPSYAIGGTVSGLDGTVELQNNGANNRALSSDGAFSFVKKLKKGDAYQVTVLTQPAEQTCTVSNGSGTVGDADVGNVAITCVDRPRFTVGGTVSDLTGALGLRNNGGNDLTVSASGGFTFTATVLDGGDYDVTVQTQPAGQICTVSNGSGTVDGANVTDVAVSCVSTHTVGGTISGLSVPGTVELRNNGGDNLTRSANGGFTFATVLTEGSSYAVSVLTQPAGQTCTVSNGSGTVGTANISDVTVTCVNNYTVGGTVTGLTGTVVLQNNGGDDLNRAADGNFTFATALVDGSAYDVTVLDQPAGQFCTVSNGAGSLSGANVTAVTVECVNSISLSVALNPDTVRPSDSVEALIRVTNRGDSAVDNIVLQARFPTSGVNSLSNALISSGGSCPGGSCGLGELVTWTIGSLAAGQGTIVSLPIFVSSSVSDGALITVPAEVQVDGDQVATASESVTVDGDNALSLNLDVSKGDASPGDALSYTLTYANRSGASITGTTLTLPLPEGVTFASATGGGTLVGDSVEWTLGTLLTTQSGRQQVVVTVDSDADAGTVLAVDAAELAGTSATTGAELAQAAGATQVVTAPVLGLQIEMDSDPVRTGDGIRARLTVTNHSATTLTNTQLQARFPMDNVGSLNDSLISGGGTCPGGSCGPGELVTWTVGTLTAGAGVTVMLPMYISSSTDSGTLMGLHGIVTADTVSPEFVSHTVVVDDNALSLALNEDKDAVTPGGTLTYTLTYGNRSGASLTGSTLTLPLPAGVTFVSATGGGTLVNDSVQWSLGTLTAGQVGRRQVTVTVNSGPDNGAVLAVDAAQIAATSATTGTELARATAATRLLAAAPLALSVAISPNPIGVSQTMTVSLTVTNTGAVPLDAVSLQARFPTDGTNSLSDSLITGGGTCPGGSCGPGEFVTWPIGTLAAGDDVTVSMPVPVSSSNDSGNLIAIDAQVSSATGDQAVAGDTAAVGTGSF